MTILINDLQQNLELDTKAMAGVRGGYSALVAVQGLSAMPHTSKMSGFAAPYSFNSKSLSNISEQLNIAVGSANVMQGNSNSVVQY